MMTGEIALVGGPVAGEPPEAAGVRRSVVVAVGEISEGVGVVCRLDLGDPAC
jgi:hypothetical protein